ncbi:MAG: YceI family protein [Bifidobacteriaceae bacterium]|jgi:polyisoprenoid-binding protein YceI|nr:YceI family protein [Bifidobacteriaceae bacterium]
MTQTATKARHDAPDLTSGRWTADLAYSSIHFKIGHPRVIKVRGFMPLTGGYLEVGQSLADSTVDLRFDPAGVRTGVGRRDAMLLGPNFFDVDSYPVWSFRSSLITRLHHHFSVVGELTMHGMSHPVSFTAQFDGLDVLVDDRSAAVFTADAEIDRFDWGLTWTEDQAGSRVRSARDVAIGVHLVVVRQ